MFRWYHPRRNLLSIREYRFYVAYFLSLSFRSMLSDRAITNFARGGYPDPEESLKEHSIVWRRLDQPGHESARLFFQDSCWQLIGTAVFPYDQQPCRLDYLVVCDTEWQTLSGRVTGWVGNQLVEVALLVDSTHHWRLNGTECF